MIKIIKHITALYHSPRFKPWAMVSVCRQFKTVLTVLINNIINGVNTTHGFNTAHGFNIALAHGFNHGHTNIVLNPNRFNGFNNHC